MNMRIPLALAAALALAAPVCAQQSFGQMQPAQPQTGQQQFPQDQGPGMQPGMGPEMQPPVQPPPMNGGAMPPPDMSGAQGMNPTMQQMQAIVQQERQDWGVPPQSELQPMDRMHGPTPTSIPGGQVITTDQVFAFYQQAQGQQTAPLIFDVLGSNEHLPMAQNAVGAAQPGSFSDQVQQEFGQFLQGATQGNKAAPMVFYCQGTQCWMSYNAALRAINLGYTQVYWYRGGVEAWNSMMQLASSMPQQGMDPGMGMGTNPGMNPGAGTMQQQGMYPQQSAPPAQPVGYSAGY